MQKNQRRRNNSDDFGRFAGIRLLNHEFIRDFVEFIGRCLRNAVWLDFNFNFNETRSLAERRLIGINGNVVCNFLLQNFCSDV